MTVVGERDEELDRGRIVQKLTDGVNQVTGHSVGVCLVLVAGSQL